MEYQVKIKFEYCYLISILFLLGLIISCSPQTESSKIYVANEGDGTISVIGAESLEVIKTIKLGGMPHNVNVDPLGKYFYATNHEESIEKTGHGDEHAGHVPYLRILDAKSSKLLHSIPMNEIVAHVVPSKDGKFVYVSREGGDTIVEVDLEKEKITNIFKVGEGPHGFVLSNDGKKLYVPNMKSHDVSIVDLASGQEERLSLKFNGNTCETPVAMGITNDDKHSFVTCGKSFEIYKIDNINKKIVARLGLKNGEFPGPIQVPVHQNNKYIYVPDMRNGVVHKVGIENFELIKDIPTATGAHGIAYSLDGKTAYVTNTWDNSLSVIDLESDTSIKKIEVGLKPNGVAVSNGKNQGW